MTLEQIKSAVDAGETVHWSNKLYRVVKVGSEYRIACATNSHQIGLIWADGQTMNGKPSDFYVAA